MASASYKERQEDELQVLQAIFMDDFQDLRNKDAWKVDRPPEIRLTLKPQQSMGNLGEHHVQLDLLISCPATYPDVQPEIKLENNKGLSNTQMTELRSSLEMVAKRNVGQEMLLEMSQCVQQFLYDNNKPPAESFYEQMMSNRKRQEEKNAQEQEKRLEIQRKRAEKERQIITDQVQKMREAQKEDTRKRKEERRQASMDRDIPSTRLSGSPLNSPVKSGSPSESQFRNLRAVDSLTTSPVVIRRAASEHDTKPTRQRSTSRNYDDDLPHHCKHHTCGTVDLVFNTGKQEHTVHKGTCLGHGLHGSTVYVGIDKKTGELVAISEWVLQWRQVAKKSHPVTTHEREPEAETYIKQIVSIEQEMSSLLKLKHRNLLQYLAFKYTEEPGRIIVYVLMEYSGGQNFDIYLTRKMLPLDMLHAYTEELLQALEYLHNKAVVHKNIRATSVFVDVHGRARLADYSVNKRLCDLYTLVEKSNPGVKFTDKQSPVIGRGGKKGDIYQLGVLLLSLSLGYQVEDLLPTVPTNLPAVFQDFLANCLLKDDKLRWSSTQLLEHQFVKEPVPHMIMQPEQDEEKQKEDQDAEKEDDSDSDDDINPVITAWEASGHSRLTNEFHVMKSLGKGGFGDVIKVKNRLDGRNYAIKRIPLNPKSQHFNKKITREVKLLSRLNHENVVRYYNSWIETSDETALTDSEGSSLLSETPKNSVSEKKVGLPFNFLKNSFDMNDDIEKFAPEAQSSCSDGFSSLEISRSRSQVFQDDDSDSSSDSSSDSEDEEDFLGLSFMHGDVEESLEGIVFEENLDEADLAIGQPGDVSTNKIEVTEQSSCVLYKQYLYIQMEYCEKSTLRNCIDVGLYQDKDRVWRLFREIVEGLMHIHEQGIIHRDLKPVNIFLDSNDHVKIGDFGLATSDILSKSTLKDCAMLMTSAGDIHDSCSRSGSLGDGNLTGQVGTALYVSPEMMIVRNNRVTYSQKVDIYSLGIIFFEMCYRPLDTNMERVKVLSQLRMKEVIFPEEFEQPEVQNDECHILRWLLNHDPNERPTSKEILQSGWLPPPQMEEAELNEVLRSAISDPQSKSYHRMMNALFSQSLRLVDDHVYDSDIHKGSFSMKTSITQQLVLESLVKVFHRHGAVKVQTPLLMPRPQMYENHDQYPCLMDHGGKLVGLPFDLRVPFARYVTRVGITNLKRYCIEKVFKRKAGDFHPKEQMECAFDIITNYVSLIPDAEVMVVAQEIINEFPPLQHRNYYVRLNHMSLLKAVLLHFDVREEDHLSVLLALAESKRDTRSRLKALSQFSLSEQSATMLVTMLDVKDSFKKVESMMRIITKTKGLAGSLAKKGLHEIEAVITYAEYLGLKLPVMVSVGLIHPNYQVYNGLVFQVTVDVTRKKKKMQDVIAAGGRYDDLIQKFESVAQMASQTPSTCTGVGFSIAFEKIVKAVEEQPDYGPCHAYDILVCTTRGRKPMFKEKMLLIRELWNAGLKADMQHEPVESPEEVQDYCRVQGISQLVILKDSEGSSVKVRSIEKEKIAEKVMSTSVLVEFLQSKLQMCAVDTRSGAQTTSNKPNMTAPPQQENTSQSTPSTGNTANFNFVFPDGYKFASNTRKKCEAMIISKVKTSFPWLTVKCIEVLAVDLTVSALRIITALLDVDSTESAFEASIGPITEKLPRHRKYLNKITDSIYRLVFKDKCSCVIMYGIKDDSVKLLTSS